MDDENASTPPPAASSTGPVVPVHPESVEDDERTLRWVMPVATLGFVGVPSRIPQVLQCLLDEGVLESVTIGPAAVHTTIGVGRSWRDHGAAVREAVQAALGFPEQWQPADGTVPADELLRMAVQQVIDSEVGDYIRSHGGQVRLLRAGADDVEVELSGACSHCPASDITLTDRLEAGIRSLYPQLGQLSARSESTPGIGRRMLRLLPISPR